MCGKTLDDRYVLESVIGLGGMGAVFRATHALVGHSVAVKVMLDTQVDAAEMKARFLREARILAALKSPHLAPVTDAGRWGEGYYLVMELLEGETLEQRYRRTQVTEGELISIALELCDGLAVAHDNAVVHRDLKASNVFITTQQNGTALVRILDFGIAKLSGNYELTRSSVMVGSPCYMSPEHLASSRQVDHRADIWSLGVMFYRVLGGRLPFEGASLAVLIMQILHDEPLPLPPEVSDGMREIVARCLRKSPGARYPDVRALKADLEKLASHEPILPVTTRRETNEDMSVPPPSTTLPSPDAQKDLASGTVKPEREVKPSPVKEEFRRTKPSNTAAKVEPLGPVPTTLPFVKAYSPPATSGVEAVAAAQAQQQETAVSRRGAELEAAFAPLPSSRKALWVVLGLGLAIAFAGVGGVIAFGRETAAQRVVNTADSGTGLSITAKATASATGAPTSSAAPLASSLSPVPSSPQSAPAPTTKATLHPTHPTVTRTAVPAHSTPDPLKP